MKCDRLARELLNRGTSVRNVVELESSLTLSEFRKEKFRQLV